MRRYAPLIVLLALVLTVIVVVPRLGWDSLARDQRDLTQAVAAHPVLTGGLFILAYALTAALSLPHGAMLTVAGGLLFGTVAGCILTVVGATAGASILVMVVRTSLAGVAARQLDRIPATMRERLARDGFSYLLALRLAPVFPFWLVNLAAAFAGIGLRVFVSATLLGVLPASLILSSIGAGISSVLARGETPDLSVLFSPRILLPLLGLSVLSLLPALLRRRRDAHA